jgi:solute:Na+ symporter, SSS family
MNMQWVDWTIVGALLGVVFITGILTKKYVRGVADYLSANRCAGRYLLTVAQGMSGISAVALVANYEKFYSAGFPAFWWQQLLIPVMLLIAITGFVCYRFRETRAMTMAEFFEMRYSRKFRVFSGFVCWIAGILNYGIFPGVTARLLIRFCGLPEAFHVWGLNIPSLPVVMLVLLSAALFLTLTGGQIALLVTDFIQGQFALIVMISVVIFLMFTFDWEIIMEALRSVPQNKSMLSPYKQSEIGDFSVQFFLMFAFMKFYTFMAWQGSQGYFSSAKNPHEAKMAGILGVWRSIMTDFTLVLAPVIAFIVFHHVAYSADADAIQASLNTISDPQVQVQMRTPLTLVHFLPVGMIGLFAAMAIAAAVSTDDTYLHSWGSIFVQDVLLPFKKKKLSASDHLKWLRRAVIGTAVFVFFYSLLVPLKQYIFMYWQVTAAIFTGGAGAVIIGGLYWKRGTAAGAWAAMISGSVLALVSIVLRTCWDRFPALVEWSSTFPLNGMQVAFATSLICVALYVVVSLLTCKEPCNMDKLLHRGAYAVEGEHITKQEKPRFIWRLLGVDKEYSRKDKLVAALVTAYILFWCSLLGVGTLLNAIMDVPDEIWGTFWHILTIGLTSVAAVTVAWFVFGGILDFRTMFKLLRGVPGEAQDDGTVSGRED